MKQLMLMTGALAATAMQAGTMLTPWGEKVTSENAWRGYPRPQMVRENWTNLNGKWDYAITDIGKTDARPEKWDGKILVPFALEAPLSGCTPQPRNSIQPSLGMKSFTSSEALTTTSPSPKAS